MNKIVKITWNWHRVENEQGSQEQMEYASLNSVIDFCGKKLRVKEINEINTDKHFFEIVLVDDSIIRVYEPNTVYYNAIV